MKFFVFLWGLFICLIPISATALFVKKGIDNYFWFIPAWIFLLTAKNVLEYYVNYIFPNVNDK